MCCGGRHTANLVYVRTTPLEVSLLEQDLAQAIPGLGQYKSVWSGKDDPPEVALTTYSCLHGYLRGHVGQERTVFEKPTVVVLEHEIGVWVEGVITRDMLALVAARLAEDQDGPLDQAPWFFVLIGSAGLASTPHSYHARIKGSALAGYSCRDRGSSQRRQGEKNLCGMKVASRNSHTHTQHLHTQHLHT